MREIKFRAWDGRKVWLVSELQFAKGNSEFIERYGTEISCLIRGVDAKGNRFAGVMPDGDTALMQYTGLKDKNGKEIYEGDVIWYGLNLTGDKYMGEVVFDEGGFNLKSPLSDELLPLYGADMIEVIDNIYENLELLK